MSETPKNYDYPADGSNSVMATPGSLKDTSREQLDHNGEMIRRIRAGEQIGEVALTDDVITEQPTKKPAVQKYSQGTYHGH